MKALILSIEGYKAVVLFEGGEMRTVRTREDWRVGQEVLMEEAVGAALPRKKVRPLLYMIAAAAALIVLWFGWGGAGNAPIVDRTDYQPLSSGGVGAYVVPSAEPDETNAAETLMPESTFDSAVIVEPTREIFPEPTFGHGFVWNGDDDDEDDDEDDEDEDDDDEDDDEDDEDEDDDDDD